MVSLNNNGKIDGYIAQEFENSIAEYLILNKNTVIYQTLSDDINIATMKGKLIASLSNLPSQYNEHHAVINGAIYTWDLKNKYDLEENEMTVAKVMTNCMILKQGSKYYRYGSDVTVTEIGANVRFFNAFYVVRTGTSTYIYDVYNDLGVKLASLTDEPTYIVGLYEDAYLVRSSTSNGYKYYYISN
jgi:hypothetical protein